MHIPMVSNCCYFCSPKTGTKTIGWINVVSIPSFTKICNSSIQIMQVKVYFEPKTKRKTGQTLRKKLNPVYNFENTSWISKNLKVFKLFEEVPAGVKWIYSKIGLSISEWTTVLNITTNLVLTTIIILIEHIYAVIGQLKENYHLGQMYAIMVMW